MSFSIVKNRPLKYIGYSIVFQEVPNEISLVFNISDCPYRCTGCHSKYLWEYNGSILKDNIYILIEKNINIITCVCLFGGDQNMNELYEILLNVRNKYNLKTCLYSGSDDISIFDDVLPLLNYIKIGKYNSELGGLDSELSNQRMYFIENGKIIDDITYKFKKEYIYREITND